MPLANPIKLKPQPDANDCHQHKQRPQAEPEPAAFRLGVGHGGSQRRKVQFTVAASTGVSTGSQNRCLANIISSKTRPKAIAPPKAPFAFILNNAPIPAPAKEHIKDITMHHATYIGIAFA
jgi:hypothetical protein